MDAYEDLEEDLRKQCYNPLKRLHERADYEEQDPADPLYDDRRVQR